jgi:hypothetical protein
MDQKAALLAVTSALEVVNAVQIEPFGVARPVASALPWTTSASGAEIGLPDGSRDSWWSVRPGDRGAMPDGSRDEGRRLVYSAQNLWHTALGSGDPGRRAGDDGVPTLLSISNE